MKIFELNFNPNQDSNKRFASFLCDPENIYEKKLGSLYMLGSISDFLPQNNKLLDNLAAALKKRFYNSPAKTPEQALTSALKDANIFLSYEVKRNNVDWLGKINFSVISVKNFEINFTKAGEHKIFLMTPGEFINIGDRPEFGEIEPYPLKIFNRIVSGKLKEGDILLVFTKEIYGFLKKEGYLDKIAGAREISKKTLQDVLKIDEKKLENLSGICLIIQFGKEDLPKEKIFFQKKKEDFIFGRVFGKYFKPVKKFIKWFKQIVGTFIRGIKNIRIGNIRKKRGKSGQTKKTGAKPQKKDKKTSQTRVPEKMRRRIRKLWALKISLPDFRQIWQFLRKNFAVIVMVVAVVALTLILLQKSGNSATQSAQLKVSKATGLILKDEKTANELFGQAWEELSLIQGNRAAALKEKIKENFFPLNKIEEIKNPELAFSAEGGFAKGNDFLPQKILTLDAGEDIILFNSSSKVFILNAANKNNTKRDIGKNIQLAAGSGAEAIFISDEGAGSLFDGADWASIKLPFAVSDFVQVRLYNLNLYFLDKNGGNITKSAGSSNFIWGKPTNWFKTDIEKPVGIKTFAVDNSVWFVNANNEISRYYKGVFQEKINLEIFPKPKDFQKIEVVPDIPYLFILEPRQKRIIILDKQGKVVKQFWSEKFDNLLDFAVSGDGKIIYLLNGLKVYKISI